MESTKKFYVTTPIYYVTAQPHLGSLYSTLLADVLARWHKYNDKRVFFLTGTDEHGQKIAQAAQKAGKQPKEFVDGFINDYKHTWKQYDIEYDHFIRTTDEYHIRGAQQFVQKLIDNGYVYKSEYTGMYCTPCETFVIDENRVCPSCGRETVILSEETYFFKLSNFTDKLLEFYNNNPHFIVPKERFNEVIAFVKSGLKDLSISRTSVPWGVPFPGDSRHTVYVWVEALCNYITGIGYGQPGKEEELQTWWPADIHVIGKDIIKFHAVYWPALLMAAEMSLPKHILVHGWITVDKQKMSKSLGNVIDPLALQQKYGADSVRYYLLRQLSINQDGDFSIADLEQRIESDLANDLGNLLNRMVTVAHKYNLIQVSDKHEWSEASLALLDIHNTLMKEYVSYMNECLFHQALATMWKFINATNSYFHSQEPWKVAQSNPQLFEEIIAATCQSLHTIGELLAPIMPQKMSDLLASINDPSHAREGVFVLKKIPPLFEKPITMNTEVTQGDSSEKKELSSCITIDDLSKVELRVGTIEACSNVEGSDKLVAMTVDLGDQGKRTVLAGLKKYYTPDQLVGKRGLYVTNLKPRKMAGIESHGMMLIGEGDNGKPQLISAHDSVPNGARLR